MIRADFRTLVLAIALVLPAAVCNAAELRFSGIFSDHMVLQRDHTAAVWGQASPGALVSIQFGEQTISTESDAAGKWQAALSPTPASAIGKELVARSGNQVVRITDVVVGDVWHASGQSNMAMTVAAVWKKLPEVKTQAFDFESIRFRRINEPESPTALDDIPAANRWVTCSRSTVPGVSATAFFFARRVHQDQQVPIGIIDSSRGGTPIEPFIPRTAFTGHPTLEQELQLGDKEDLEGIWKLPGGVRARSTTWLPGRLFHSRLSPIKSFAAKGVVWYQGESNCGRSEDPRDYRHKMRALVEGWRSQFANASMPFYFVQLPGSGASYGWPYLREEQRLSLSVPNTGMAVTIDLVDSNIHPANKIDVGERLARWALAKTYNRPVACSGPLLGHVQTDGSSIIVRFKHVGSGLMAGSKSGLSGVQPSRSKAITHFEIAGTDDRWHKAEATIRGETVVVHNKMVEKPVAVRYAFDVNPSGCNLYNREGLPASPFCSDPKRLIYDPAAAE